MSAASLRVVLDSNVFSATHFDTIDSSRMRDLCRNGRVVAVYSGEMMDETVRAYLQAGTRADLLEKWLPFILQTATRLCDELPAIWHKELVQGRGRKTCIFMSPAKQRSVVEHFRSLPIDGSSALINSVRGDWANGMSRRAARRENAKRMRTEVAELTRELGVRPQGRLTLRHSDQEALAEMIAFGMVRRFVAPHDWRAVAQRWSRDKRAYPYFTQFVRNVVYQEMRFMTNHSAKIDRNAQPDLDILTHLLEADAIVTNEAGFMRSAFDDLWRGRGKAIFSSPEFATFLGHL